MKAVNNTHLNISLDQDLVDFVMPGARRWHGERIVVLIAFIVYGFNNVFFRVIKIKDLWIGMKENQPPPVKPVV